jgi:hypothetical protein
MNATSDTERIVRRESEDVSALYNAGVIWNGRSSWNKQTANLETKVQGSTDVGEVKPVEKTIQLWLAQALMSFSCN